MDFVMTRENTHRSERISNEPEKKLNNKNKLKYYLMKQFKIFWLPYKTYVYTILVLVILSCPFHGWQSFQRVLLPNNGKINRLIEKELPQEIRSDQQLAICLETVYVFGSVLELAMGMVSGLFNDLYGPIYASFVGIILFITSMMLLIILLILRALFGYQPIFVWKVALYCMFSSTCWTSCCGMVFKDLTNDNNSSKTSSLSSLKIPAIIAFGQYSSSIMPLLWLVAGNKLKTFLNIVNDDLRCALVLLGHTVLSLIVSGLWIRDVAQIFYNRNVVRERRKWMLSESSDDDIELTTNVFQRESTKLDLPIFSMNNVKTREENKDYLFLWIGYVAGVSSSYDNQNNFLILNSEVESYYHHNNNKDNQVVITFFTKLKRLFLTTFNIIKSDNRIMTFACWYSCISYIMVYFDSKFRRYLVEVLYSDNRSLPESLIILNSICTTLQGPASLLWIYYVTKQKKSFIKREFNLSVLLILNSLMFCMSLATMVYYPYAASLLSLLPGKSIVWWLLY